MSKYNFRKVVSLLNCFVQHLPGKMQVRYKGGGGHSYVVKGWQGGGVSPPKVWILGFFIVKLGDNF